MLHKLVKTRYIFKKKFDEENSFFNILQLNWINEVEYAESYGKSNHIWFIGHVLVGSTKQNIKDGILRNVNVGGIEDCNMTNVTKPNVTGIEDFNMTNVTKPDVTGIEDFNMTNVTKPNVTGIEDFNMTNVTKPNVTGIEDFQFSILFIT